MARSSNSKKHLEGRDESMVKPKPVILEEEGTDSADGSSSSEEEDEKSESLEESETVKSISLSDDCKVEILKLITKNSEDFKTVKDELKTVKDELKDVNSLQNKIIKLLEKMVEDVSSNFSKLFSKDDSVKKIAEEVFTLIKNDEDFKKLLTNSINEKNFKKVISEIKSFIKTELEPISKAQELLKNASETEKKSYELLNKKLVEKIDKINNEIVLLLEVIKNFDIDVFKKLEEILKSNKLLKPSLEIFDKILQEKINIPQEGEDSLIPISSDHKKFFEDEVKNIKTFFNNLNSEKVNKNFSSFSNKITPFLEIRTDKETENLIVLTKILKRLESKSEKEKELLTLLKKKNFINNIEKIEKILSSEDEKNFKEKTEELIRSFDEISLRNMKSDFDFTLVDDFRKFFEKNPSLNKESELKEFLDKNDKSKEKFLSSFVEFFSLFFFLEYLSKFSKDGKNPFDLLKIRFKKDILKTKIKDNNNETQYLFDDVNNINFESNDKLSEIIIRLKNFFESNKNSFLINLKTVLSDFFNEYNNSYNQTLITLKSLKVFRGNQKIRMIKFIALNGDELLLERFCPKKAFFNLRCSTLKTIEHFEKLSEIEEKTIEQSRFKNYSEWVGFPSIEENNVNSVKNFFYNELLVGYKITFENLDDKRKKLAKNFVEGILITLFLGELIFVKIFKHLKKDFRITGKRKNVKKKFFEKINEEKLEEIKYDDIYSNFLKLYGELIKGVKNGTTQETKKNCFWEIFKNKKTIISEQQMENISKNLEEGRKIVENFYGKGIIEKELKENQILDIKKSKSPKKGEDEETSLDNLEKKPEAEKISKTEPPSNKGEKTSSKTRETGENKILKNTVKDIQKVIEKQNKINRFKKFKNLKPESNIKGYLPTEKNRFEDGVLDPWSEFE